ncbi:MAG TPA: CsgG/HfaB family protein [Pirellulales bacterium]|nr:CsgG/HfaB family protein [Pirellulales bacterium]
MKRELLLTALAAVTISTASWCRADDDGGGDEVYPAAVLAFQERGAGVKGYAAKVGDVLFATLSAEANLVLVEREELDKTINEQQLNVSGLVKADEAAQIGQLTGAKILITGSVTEVDMTVYLVSKLIGTETGRVLGVTVKGKIDEDLGPLVEKLGAQISEAIVKQSGKLVAKRVKVEDRIANLLKKLKDGEKPTVSVNVSERHIGQPTIDPAAQTEISRFCQETGFTVIDSDEKTKRKADVLITGEGFSEMQGRVGNLASVKARVEIKAVDRKTGKVLATDRQTAIAVDLGEQVAGKTALQDAAAQIAERLLPKLLKK